MVQVLLGLAATQMLRLATLMLYRTRVGMLGLLLALGGCASRLWVKLSCMVRVRLMHGGIEGLGCGLVCGRVLRV